MAFELNNDERRYLGLNKVNDDWKKRNFNDETYIYHDGEIITSMN